MNIPNSYTTNPQAEVLVFDSIGVEYILGIACGDIRVYNTLKGKYGNEYSVEHEPWLFSYREDYLYWR